MLASPSRRASCSVRACETSIASALELVSMIATGFSALPRATVSSLSAI